MTPYRTCPEDVYGRAMSFGRGEWVFVDESKAHGYYIAAAAVARGDIAGTEKRLRALRMGHRSSLHFHSEGNRRSQLLREFCQMDVRATVYVMRGHKDRVARPALLRALVGDMVADGAQHLVLERDESVEVWDRRTIRERLDKVGGLGKLVYEHKNRNDQPMLWLADAVAWCYQKGNPWKTQVQPIVSGVITVDLP